MTATARRRREHPLISRHELGPPVAEGVGWPAGQWHHTFGRPRGRDAQYIHDETHGVSYPQGGGPPRPASCLAHGADLYLISGFDAASSASTGWGEDTLTGAPMLVDDGPPGSLRQAVRVATQRFPCAAPKPVDYSAFRNGVATR